MLDYFHDKIIEEKNYVAYGFSIISGWVVTLYALPDNGVVLTLSWMAFLKTIFGIGVSMLTLFSGMIVTDIYKYVKPKLLKSLKRLFHEKK